VPEITLTLPEAIKRAAAAYQAGRLDESERLCLAILGVKVDDFNALHLLAIVKCRGLYAQAQANFERALAVRPDHAEAHFNRGVSLHVLKRYEEALASYDRSLELRPDDAKTFNERGNTLKELKRFRGGARELRPRARPSAGLC
jgi:tetratricopeptide (TPR) repeat protein